MLLKNGLGARIKPGQEEIMEKAIKAMAKKIVESANTIISMLSFINLSDG